MWLQGEMHVKYQNKRDISEQIVVIIKVMTIMIKELVNEFKKKKL